MMRVHHYGYSAYGAAGQVEHLMRDERVLLIDTRLKPHSWRPEWTEAALRKKYGARYRQAGYCLGNLNFKGGPLKIVDIEKGVKGLMMYLQEGYDLILLCQCAHTGCHRYTILDALKQSLPWIEIVSPDSAATPDTIPCLSIMQPWSYLIVNKFKDIENREWTTAYRGPLLIHAGAKYDPAWFCKGNEYISQIYLDKFGLDGYVPYTKAGYPISAIVGRADLVNVVTESESPWFFGKYGFVLENAQPIEPIPYKGQLKLFPVSMSVLEGITP